MRKNSDEGVAYTDTDFEKQRAYGLLRIIEDDNHPVRRVSMASVAWRKAASAKLQQFLHAFSATPEGNALVGIQIANGVYGEWHNWGGTNMSQTSTFP